MAESGEQTIVTSTTSRSTAGQPDRAGAPHPAILTKGGLSPALNALIRRSPIAVQLHLDITKRLTEQVEVSAYYVVAEALTNSAKHSRASTVTVTVNEKRAERILYLEVADDGIGGADLSGGTGLLGLKDRVETLGGHIDLHRSQGAGTTLRVELPVTPPKGEPYG